MNNAPVVTIKNNAVVASSRDVADFFGKAHKHVLAKIEELVCMSPDIQPYLRPVEIATGTPTRQPLTRLKVLTSQDGG